jgi:HAE1 family hydrophobic/amphiphilic exporter-1
MKIWEFCIERPVFTLMFISAPVVLGIAAYANLGVDLFPDVDLPVVVITTTLKGASIEEMETSVTKRIEEAVNTISGIDELRSTTKEGFSQVVISFDLYKNADVAAQEVRDKISTIVNQFPIGTDPPVIDKFDLDAAPVATIAVSGKRDFRELTEIARKSIKEELETVRGVGTVVLVGGRKRAIQVYVDPDKLAAYGLSVHDVREALIRQNVELPGGRVDQQSREFVLRTMGRLERPEQFADIIITERNDQTIRIRDVGRVEDDIEEPRGLSRLDGENAVSLIVQKQSGTNTVEVVRAVKQRLRELQSALPPDIRMMLIRDQSRFIEASIDEVKFHALLAAVLVSLTILFFIRDWRTTVIASLAIPTSMVPTFAFMAAMDYTLNNITMLGLILAIGIVIDDAVVVHENIFRHMEELRRPAREAARTATAEIASAVLATTLSLLVIFVPVAFMQGRVGRFFNSFGFTVGFAVFMSLVVSFTMTPMLCSRFLKLSAKHHHSKQGFLARLIENTYVWVLAFALRRRWLVVAATVGTLLSTPVIFSWVGKDFVPHDDQSEFEVVIQFPEGYTLDEADKRAQELERKLSTLRGVLHVFTTIGDTTGRVAKGQGDVTEAKIYCRLIDLRQRDYTQKDVMREARALLAEYPDLRAAVQDVQAFQATGFRQVDVDLNLVGPDLYKLQEYADRVTQWMKQQGHYVDVDTSLSLSKPELRVWVDRERAADLGLPLQTIASTLNLFVGGEPVTTYKERDEQYDVWLRAEKPFRNRAEALEALTIPSPQAGLVRLNNVARVEPALGPNSIDRFGRQRQIVVVANLQGISLGEAVRDISQFMDSLDLPPEYRYEFIGRAKLLAESNRNFLIAFVLSFIFMYMVLAAQFESFVHPLTILLALPLTLPFAFLSLFLIGTNLDIYATFGLFMLFGIVKKNGILQIDYTNVLRRRGMELRAAILEANRTRLRPILMTTVMLVAAMIPIALGRGPGAAARASMAKVIIGGQVLSLLLTLIVTPVAYSLWEDLTQWWWRVRGKSPEVQPQVTELATTAPEASVEAEAVPTRLQAET